MRTMWAIICLCVFSACAQTGKIPKVSMTIRPGEVRFIEFPAPDSKINLSCRGEKIKFSRNEGKAQAIIVESYFSLLDPFSCKVEANDRIIQEIEFKVENREYLAEQLKVDPKRIKLSPKDEKRVAEEQAVLNKIYASSLPEFQFQDSFTFPMSSVVTSVYGTKRVYNKKKKGQHLGIDYRAAIGDKVPATNAGRIVFAGDLFYTGWTVIIDHGLDVFTVYGHLSKTLVKAGDVVKKGDLIGLSGNTGRTSGPHLHWGVKIQGQYVDGFVLIEETQKYFRH